MSFLTRLFSSKKTVSISIKGLGEFTYYKDKIDEYWQTEKPVGKLPNQFDFGAIHGDIDGPNSEALETFKYFSTNVEEIFNLVNSLFFEKVSPKFGKLNINQVKSKFFIKTLTCSSKNKFEFGLHSLESDVFIELFCRNGVVTEIHIDEDCCESM